MNALQEWLDRTGERPHTLAKRMKKPASTITRILRGERGVGIRLAREIEVATGGDVTAAQMLLAKLGQAA